MQVVNDKLIKIYFKHFNVSLENINNYYYLIEFSSSRKDFINNHNYIKKRKRLIKIFFIENTQMYLLINLLQ